MEHHALIDAKPRDEDVSRAAAELDFARAAVDEARVMLSKTVVRSPIDGAVLRKYLNAGETAPLDPKQPIVQLGDMSRLHVRVEVDEEKVEVLKREPDVGKAHFGSVSFA